MIALDPPAFIRCRLALDAVPPKSAGHRQALIHEVGYSDGKTFRSGFKRVTGVTPQGYRNKYGRV